MIVRRRRIAGVALLAAAIPCAACVETREVLGVVLEPVVAKALSDDVTDGHIGFSWVDEDGAGDGLGADEGAGFVLVPSARQLSFTVRLDDAGYTRLTGLGRTGFVDVRDGDGVALPEVRQRVLLAPADRVGLLVDVPVALGGDECVVGDEAGRLFVVGGSAGNQGGYVVDDFGVRGLDDAERWTRASVVGCGASRGAVAAVVGCGRSGADVVVAGIGARAVPLAAVEAAGGPVSCAARVVPVEGGVWLADGGSLSFVDDAGAVVSSTASQPGAAALAGFASLVSTLAGEAAVVDGVGVGGVLRVVGRGGASREVRAGLGVAARLGRRSGDVMLLDGAVLVGLDGGVVRDDVAAELSSDGAASFAVLSDGTVVALAGRQVLVSASGQPTQRLSLATERYGLVALPGDTVMFGGGDAAGVDVVALSAHRVEAAR